MVKKNRYEYEEDDYDDTIIWKIIGIVLVVALAFSLTQLNECRNVEPEALLNVEVIGLNEDFYDSNKIFYTYRVDNFGDVEAKNVKVRCKIFDYNENVVSSVLDNIGNIASNSYETFEVVTNNIAASYFEDGSYACHVESCDDCVILYENIPDLFDYYN